MKEYTSDGLFYILEEYKDARSEHMPEEDLAQLREKASDYLVFLCAAEGEIDQGADGEWTSSQLQFFSLEKDATLLALLKQKCEEYCALLPHRHPDIAEHVIDTQAAPETAESSLLDVVLDAMHAYAATQEGDVSQQLLARDALAAAMASLAYNDGNEEYLMYALRIDGLTGDEPLLALYQQKLAALKTAAVNSADTTINTPQTDGKGIAGDQSPPANELGDDGVSFP